MPEVLKKISYILKLNQKINLIILTFFWIILHFLEAVGISSVPIIVGSFLETNEIIKLDYFKNFNDYFANFYNSDDKILIISILIISFFALKTVFFIFLTFFEAKTFKELNVSIKKLVFNQQINQEYSNFINSSVSQVTKIISYDSALASSYIISLITIFSQFFLFLFVLILLAIVNFEITFFVIPIFGLIFFLFYIFTYKKLFLLGKSKQLLSGKLLKQINNTFDNLKEVIIYNKSKYLTDIFNETLNQNQKKIEQISILKKFPKAIYEFLGIIFIFTIIYISYNNNYSQEDILLLVSLIAIAIIRILPSINLITQNVSNLKSSEYSFDLISEIAKKNQFKFEQTKDENNKKLINFEKDIVFKDISFEYTKSNNNIQNLNFTIKKNSIVGIFGPSGSGKSTIANLLCGLLIPSRGEILIDGVSIKKNFSNWQKKISYVTQDNYLLDDTLKNNILFSVENNQFKSEIFSEVTKTTNLDNFVKKFKFSYQTQVGDKGIKLSGGQKQRVSIARALYKIPKLLIFDEATSALDDKTEKEIIEEIYKIKGITIIIISHNKDLLSKCDEVIDISNNQINSI